MKYFLVLGIEYKFFRNPANITIHVGNRFIDSFALEKDFPPATDLLSHVDSKWYRKHGKNYDNLPHKTLDTFAMAKSVALNHPYKNNECSLLEFQMKMIGIRKKGIKTSLGALGKSNQIEHDYSKLHDALVDLELNVKVWDKLKYQIDF